MTYFQRNALHKQTNDDLLRKNINCSICRIEIEPRFRFGEVYDFTFYRRNLKITKVIISKAIRKIIEPAIFKERLKNPIVGQLPSLVFTDDQFEKIVDLIYDLVETYFFCQKFLSVALEDCVGAAKIYFDRKGISPESMNWLMLKPLIRLKYLDLGGDIFLPNEGELEEEIRLLESKLIMEETYLSSFLSPSGLLEWTKIKNSRLFFVAFSHYHD